MAVFFGYTYRWIAIRDEVADLVRPTGRTSQPIQRQLLGGAGNSAWAMTLGISRSPALHRARRSWVRSTRPSAAHPLTTAVRLWAGPRSRRGWSAIRSRALMVKYLSDAVFHGGAVMVPPCASTRCRVMASPSPLPPLERLRDCSARRESVEHAAAGRQLGGRCRCRTPRWSPVRRRGPPRGLHRPLCGRGVRTALVTRLPTAWRSRLTSGVSWIRAGHRRRSGYLPPGLGQMRGRDLADHGGGVHRLRWNTSSPASARARSCRSSITWCSSRLSSKRTKQLRVERGHAVLGCFEPAPDVAQRVWQCVGDVADHLLALPLGRFQLAGHLVERRGERADLASVAGGDPRPSIARADPLGGHGQRMSGRTSGTAASAAIPTAITRITSPLRTMRSRTCWGESPVGSVW